MPSTNLTFKDFAMKRPALCLAFLTSRYASSVLLTAAFAALLLMPGCQPAEVPKPKESKPEAAPSQAGAAGSSEKPSAQAAGAAAEAKDARENGHGGDGTDGGRLSEGVELCRHGHRAAVGRAGDQKIDQKEDFSVTLVRPNKIRLQAYQANFVCDGNLIHASIKDLAGQVLVKPAPPRITLAAIYHDPNLATALSRGSAGPLPQLFLLLSEHPLKDLLQEGEEPRLVQPGQIEGRNCHRVELKRPEGTLTFWIDQESYVLRRIVLPVDDLRRELSREKPVETISLVAEFTGATLNGKVDPKAFTFECPRDPRWSSSSFRPTPHNC